MTTPTTLRGELLRSVRTFNDRMFLTIGSSGAGATPYNPMQVGLGARLVVQTDRNVNSVRMTLSRVTDQGGVPVGVLNPVRTSDTTWEVEGAIGGARLGFPQPTPSYHVAQCFELRMEARNRGKTDVKVFNFWVGDGVAGTIASCVDRPVIGVKPLIAGLDELGWYEAFPDSDNHLADFFSVSSDIGLTVSDPDLVGLQSGDPRLYEPGLADFFGVSPAPENPWVRFPEPPSENLTFSASIARSIERLRAGYGLQWHYRAIENWEKFANGLLQKAPRSAPAAVPSSGGTGVADTLNANPQIGQDIGGSGINFGFPNGVQGVQIELLSDDTWGTSNDDYEFRIALAEWLGPSNFDVYVLVGTAADWAGGGVGGTLVLAGTQPAHLLCSVNQAAAYYHANIGDVAWPSAATLATPLSMEAGEVRDVFLRKSTSGVTFTDDVALVVHVFVHDASAGPSAGGSGYFTQQFPIGTLRSNALRISPRP